MTKYLRQKGSGHIYISTPLIAGRKDMVEYDPGLAEIRIDQMKKKLEKRAEVEVTDTAEAEAMQEQAHELTELEEAVDKMEEDEAAAIAEDEGSPIKTEKPKLTDEQVAEIQRKTIIEEDPQIVKIRAMTKKSQVEVYVLEEFGTEDMDFTMDLPDLKKMAELMRIERIFED